MKRKNLIIMIIGGVLLVYAIGGTIYANQRINKLKQASLDDMWEKIELQGKLNDKNELKEQLDGCITKAYDDYWAQWTLNCTNDSKKYVDDKKDGEIKSCSVPNHLAPMIEEKYQQAMDNCFMRFK